MGKPQFDYYIFIDYSKNLIGYNILEKSRIKELLPKLSKFKHYRGLKGRKNYLKHVKNTIKQHKIRSYFEKTKVMGLKENIELFAEVLKFVKNKKNCSFFISVDDYQYRNFRKLADVLDGSSNQIVKESKLKHFFNEYKLSLVIDNILNIERMKT